MTLSVNFQMREFHWAICGTVITLNNSLNNTLDKKDNLVKRQRKAASLFLNGRGGDGVLYVRCSDSFYRCLDEKVSIQRIIVMIILLKGGKKNCLTYDYYFLKKTKKEIMQNSYHTV